MKIFLFLFLFFIKYNANSQAFYVYPTQKFIYNNLCYNCYFDTKFNGDIYGFYYNNYPNDFFFLFNNNVIFIIVDTKSYFIKINNNLFSYYFDCLLKFEKYYDNKITFKYDVSSKFYFTVKNSNFKFINVKRINLLYQYPCVYSFVKFHMNLVFEIRKLNMND